MSWLTSLLALVEAIPEVIAVIQKVVAAIQGHPQGTAAGVDAVAAHMDCFQQPGL